MTDPTTATTTPGRPGVASHAVATLPGMASDAVAPLPGVASSAVAPLLRGPRRPVRVLAVFRAAVYLAHDDGVLALVTSDGVAHPNAVVVTATAAEVPFASLRPHQRGTVGEGRVDLPGLAVPIGRWWDPRPRLAAVAPAARRDTVAPAARRETVAPAARRETVDPAALRDAVAAARRRLDGVAATADPPPDARLAAIAAAVADALAEADVAAAVATARHLLGRGPGLTPAGDDVLAGLLAATLAFAPVVRGGPREGLVATTRAAGAALADLARDATTAVSAALLDHAARGEVATPAADVLHALAGRRELGTALTSLLAVGSSSGRDLAVGMLAGADLVLDPRTTDPAPARATDPAPARATDLPTSTPPDVPASAPPDVPASAVPDVPASTPPDVPVPTPPDPPASTPPDHLPTDRIL